MEKLKGSYKESEIYLALIDMNSLKALGTDGLQAFMSKCGRLLGPQ